MSNSVEEETSEEDEDSEDDCDNSNDSPDDSSQIMPKEAQPEGRRAKKGRSRIAAKDKKKAKLPKAAEYGMTETERFNLGFA